MIPLSWSQFEKNQLAKDISFESFCYQIAFSLYHSFGRFEDYFNTPGSEFYLYLNKDCANLQAKSGDVIGWQVKWWFDSESNSSLTSKRKKELSENFITTIDSRPQITHWIICTPGLFVQSSFDNFVCDLSSHVKVVNWNKNTFQNFRSAHYDSLGHIFHHYFNTHFIGFNEVKEFSTRNLNHLKNKFDTDLYAGSDDDSELLFIADLKAALRELSARGRYLYDEINRISVPTIDDEAQFPELTDSYVASGYKLLTLCIEHGKIIYELLSASLNIEVCKEIRDALIRMDAEYEGLAKGLRVQHKNKDYLKDKSGNDRGSIWRFRDLVVDPINRLRAHFHGRVHDDKANEEGISHVIKKILQKDIHILSSAGHGKTNIVCNLCNILLEQKVPCVLLLGSGFRTPVLPQTTIVELLSWSTHYSFKELISALNNLGFIRGFKIPIIIDGLNESLPYDKIWKTNIKDIIDEINKYDYIILVTTCRDRYIEAIFEVTDIKSVPNTKLLYGLKKRSLEVAIGKYFKKYKIEPITWAFNKEIFSNPLLLKIFSEVNENSRGIAISLTNIFKSIDSYIEKIEIKASFYNSRTDPVLRAKIKSGISRFCEQLWYTGAREIPLLDFHGLIDSSNGPLNDSITERILDEGLCFQKNLSGIEETVQFTYDLVAGYCIAVRFLLPKMNYKELEIQNLPFGYFAL